MGVKLLTEHHFEFLSLKGGCTSSYESTLVKMPHCWKSCVTAQLCIGGTTHTKTTKNNGLTLDITFLQKVAQLEAAKTTTEASTEESGKTAFLTYLLSQQSLTPEEALSTAVDLLKAATETVGITSKTGFRWAIFK